MEPKLGASARIHASNLDHSYQAMRQNYRKPRDTRIFRSV